MFIIAHELGHAFGLQHTDTPLSIMKLSLPLTQNLLEYETHWLSNTHYFNDSHIRPDIPTFISYDGAEATDRFTIRYTFTATSNSGLYACKMIRWSRGGYTVGYDKLNGITDTIEINVSRRMMEGTENVSLFIMDTNGNFISHNLNVETPDNIPPTITEIDDTKHPNLTDNTDNEEPEPCLHCGIDDTTNTPDTDDMPHYVIPQNKLTTSWGRIKTINTHINQ